MMTEISDCGDCRWFLCHLLDDNKLINNSVDGDVDGVPVSAISLACSVASAACTSA